MQYEKTQSLSEWFFYLMLEYLGMRKYTADPWTMRVSTEWVHLYADIFQQ